MTVTAYRGDVIKKSGTGYFRNTTKNPTISENLAALICLLSF
jgi:hypothetical protein